MVGTGFWFTRLASERTRVARLGRAFDELCIDVRGKRVLRAAHMPHESSGRASFDVIVSSLEGGVWTDASLFSTLKDRLEPGGVLCVFVRTPAPGASDLVREDVVWTVAGSIAHAGFDVLFAEGSEHLQTVVPRLVRALRSLLELFTPRKFRENVARFLHRMNLCPRHALVVARRSFA